MRPTLSSLRALIALVATSGQLAGQTNNLALTGSPAPLTICTATAGSDLVSKSDQTARYSVTVAGGRKKITGQLDSPLPAGVSLSITLAAPSGAVSLGSVSLDGSPHDLVRYIGPVTAAGLTVTFVFAAGVNAGVVPYNSSHVVLTLVDDP